MKITHSSPDRLEIGASPGGLLWSLYAILIGLSLLGLMLLSKQLWLLGGIVVVTACVFVVVAADLGRTIQITFDRPNDLLTVRIVGFFGTRSTTHPVSGLVRAATRVGGATSGYVGKTKRAVVVTTDDREIPLNDYFETGPGAETVAAAVNTWLDVS
ncbi:MAG: hypothetical protein AAGI50_05910 [Pseudomonadota bacterium]